MDYTDCPLYNLKSKKHLRLLLSIKGTNLTKQKSIAAMVSPYIDYSSKPRLIEPPKFELKVVQRRIKNMLAKIEVPNNVYSGIRGRSYVDNAKMHSGNCRRNLFKIDLTAFFPSITRETVYRFFAVDLLCSPDVAEILTNLTTIDIEKSHAENMASIYKFLSDKGVSCTNHLISGAPTSQIMSYLVNHAMFDEMQKVSDTNGIKMTVYVDDVTFSSENRISANFERVIFSIVHKYGYQLSRKKIRKYTRSYPKLVTGVVIDSTGNLIVRNAMRKKIMDEFAYLGQHPDDMKSKQRLKGLLTAARQIDEQTFPNIYRMCFE